MKVKKIKFEQYSCYDPDHLTAYGEKYQREDEIWKAYRKDKQELSVLWGNTVFITLLKETCFQKFFDLLKLLPSKDAGYHCVWCYSYYFTNGWIRYLREQTEKFSNSSNGEVKA